MANLEPAASIATAEQALRDLINTVMTREHGAGWMDDPKVVDAEVRQGWANRRAQEERQRIGHTFVGSTDIAYAELGELDGIMKKRGPWRDLFEPALGDRAEAQALIRVLLDSMQRIRRPVAHTRPLLPFEVDLISGIAGLIRNRVTIYLSNQDPGGDYYPRIERISDSFGNTWVLGPNDDLAIVLQLRTETTVRVGDVVTFEATGLDPQGRELRWELRQPSGLLLHASGNSVSFTWEVLPQDTGMLASVVVFMSHREELYHRNVHHNQGRDAAVTFFYRVDPPV